jgi:hypothetical protein
VAAWLSETVLRGRGPGASGFESHRRGRIFSKEGISAGPWMCVYVFQGLTVGWWKEEQHSSDTTARSAGFKSRPDGPPMDVVLYSCCVVLNKFSSLVSLLSPFSSLVMQTPTFLAKLSDESIIFIIDVGKSYFLHNLQVINSLAVAHSLSCSLEAKYRVTCTTQQIRIEAFHLIPIIRAPPRMSQSFDIVLLSQDVCSKLKFLWNIL